MKTWIAASFVNGRNILDYESWQWVAKGQRKKSTWDSKYRLASYLTWGRILFEEFGPFFISNSFISDVQMQAFIPVATPVKDFPAINCLHLYPEAMSAGAQCKLCSCLDDTRSPSGPLWPAGSVTERSKQGLLWQVH